MAGLLRDSKHEDDDARMGQVASPPIQVLHLETMEETQNEGRKSNETGDSGMAGTGGEQLSESLLAHGEEQSCPEGNLKRKTRTGWILQYP